LDIENREMMIHLAFLGFSFYQSVIPEFFYRGSIAYKVAAAWIPAKSLPE
jgi:hypothetical protein